MRGRRRGLKSARWIAALGFVLWAGHARAQSLSVTVPAFTGYPENAVTVGADSSLTLELRHNATAARYQVDVRMPLTTYAATGGVGPAGWTASTYTSGGYRYVRFAAPCSGVGLAPNTPTRFTVQVRPPVGVAVDTQTSVFRVTVATTRRANGQCRSGSAISNSTSAVAWGRVLAVTGVGTALQQLAPPAVVRWTVANYASIQKTAVRVTPLPSGASCSANLTLGAYSSSAGPRTGTLFCRYPATAGQTFSVSTRATGDTSASAVGTSLSGIDVGNASVSWIRTTLVRGRVRDPLVLTVNNASRATVTRVEVGNASPGWQVSSATSSTGSLLYNIASSTGPRVVFTGAIAPGESVTLTIRYSAVPSGTSFPFQVTLTPGSGTDYAVTYGPQEVAVRTVTFPPDVSRLTIHSDSHGQRLRWTNPTSAHAGVVVLRAPAPALPSPPLDFVDYAITPNAEVVLANHTDPSLRSATDDSAIGVFNYVVCNHDASFIYSDCRTDVSARFGYSGDSAVAPPGGWTHQLGGEALTQVQVFADGRAAVPTNRGDVSIVNLADGRPSLNASGQEIEPIPLSSGVPSTYLPGWRLASGRLVAIAANEAGYLTAIDLMAGVEYWPTVRKPGESFTAGVSGVSNTGGSAAFKAKYPGMDVLFLGSATTGRILAIDASNGETLWTVSTGAAGVDTLINYDAATNYLWVATSSGVQAWDLGPSGPNASTPARLAWQADVGAHSIPCMRTTVASWMVCAGEDGTLRLLDKRTGEVEVNLATGVTLPSTLVRVAYGTPGFIIGNARQVVRVAATDASLTSLSVHSRWQPSGWTLSPALLFSASGYLIVAASDGSTQGIHLYKRSSEDLQDLGRSPDTVRPASASTLVGPASFDAAHGRYLFGTAEGRIWAVPSF